MPLYEYQCERGHVTTELRSVAHMHDPVDCPACGFPARRAIITPPRVFGDLPGYESPATGRWIDGRRARAEDLARSGCRPYESGEREELVRRQAANDRAAERAVDEAVERSIHELTT